mgnify:CR=1 FL=1
MKPFNNKYAKYYDFFNLKKNYKEECLFLKKAFEKYSKLPVKDILDLGSGTGMHSTNLAELDYNITGLDLSEDMVEIAKSRNIKNTEFIVGDMSNFKLNKKFDACICMFAAFGYLTENSQIESSLKSIKNSLNKNGLFIMDCWNGLGVMHDLPVSRTVDIEENGLRIQRKSYPKLESEKHVCEVKFNVKVSKQGKTIDEYEEVHRMRFIFPQEFRKYLEDSGFEVLKICKTFDLDSSIDENDWNMVVIARLKD